MHVLRAVSCSRGFAVSVGCTEILDQVRVACVSSILTSYRCLPAFEAVQLKMLSGSLLALASQGFLAILSNYFLQRFST